MAKKKTQEMRRKVSFNLMEDAINELREKYAKHLAIQVWYYYRKYKAYKKVKEERDRKKRLD